MGKPRKNGTVAARFFLLAVCFFTFAASGQVHRRNDSDIDRLERSMRSDLDMHERHIENNDKEIVEIKERLRAIEAWAQCIGFFTGSGVLFGIATKLQRKKDSA